MDSIQNLTEPIVITTPIIKLTFVQLMLHKIRRVFQQIIISSKKDATKSDRIPRSEFENEAIQICRNMVKRSDSELLFFLNSDERFINNDTLKMYIILKSNSIDVINHTYYYNLPVCPKTMSKLTLIFDGQKEHRKQIMKSDIFKNVKNSLQIINSKLLNEKIV